MPRHKILVIDDDSSTLEILLMILQGAGYDVEVAMGHEQGFFSKKLPDVILLDNNLGIRNGADICMEIKSDPATKHIPVILISAMNNVKRLAKDACADDFIAKPFSIEQMLDKIGKALKGNTASGITENT